MRRLPALLLAATLALPAFAQTFPSRSETPITDDADLIGPVAEAELAERLIALRQDWSVEVAVVTLLSGALYTAGEEIGDYAEMLAESWELDAATEGRSVMLLVISEDRDVHLRAGPGLPEFDAEARQAVLDEAILPAFREDRMADGLEAGVEAILARLGGTVADDPAPTGAEAAEPMQPVEDGEGGSTGLLVVGGVILAAIAGLIGLNRRSKAKLAATPCPNCGKTGLTRARVTLDAPTKDSEGRGVVRTTCPHCGHVEEEPFTISPRTPRKAQKDDREGPGGTTGSW